MNNLFSTFMRWFFAVIGVAGAALVIAPLGPPWPLVGGGIVVVAIAGMVKFTVKRR